MAKKILVVDDNEFIIQTAREELVTLNPDWQIIEAKNGKECLDVLEKNKDVDLILLDIMMPEMDGLEAANRIKKNDSLKHIPIIFLTAKTDHFSKGMGEINSEDYIEKPFDIFDLNKRIRKVLKKAELTGKVDQAVN